MKNMNEMTRKILLGGFILTALVLIAGAATAENGWIHGTVSDTYLVPKGKSISSANVSVENGGWSVLTNNTGHFNLSLPVGSYTLRATKSGYNDNVSGIVTVSANATFTQNFILVKPMS
jgi:hypothetical protein